MASGVTYTYSGTLTSPNVNFETGIDKTGVSEQVLSGNSASYAGQLAARAGVLRINGDLGNARAVETPGATISGAGSVGRMTDRGGVLRPGNNGGTLNTGDLLLFLNGALLIDLVNASPGGFGKVNAVGTVFLDSDKSSLQLAAAPGFTAPIGTVFEIVTNDGTDPVDGTFTGLPQGATVSAGSTNFTISYTGGSGNDITLTVAKTTPVMTLSANRNPVLVGGNTLLRLTVASVGGVAPTGTVAFAIAGAPVTGCAARPLSSGGVAQCNAFGSSLATAGTQSVTAVYSGDANYLPGSAAPLSLVVTGAASPFLQVVTYGSGVGTVASVPAGISCPGDCTEIFASGTAVTLTATADANSVFTGWDGACIGNTATCTLTITSAKLVNGTFALRSIVGTTPNIDIDGDGKYRAGTDGLLIHRFVLATNLGSTFEIANAVAAPAVGGTATRIDIGSIRNYITDIYPTLDVNRDGLIDATDTTVILRYLFGFRGAALVAGVTLPSGVTAAMVEANLLAITPVLP